MPKLASCGIIFPKGCDILKKFLGGIVSCLGVLSSVLALANIFPQYNSIFFVLIGIFVGFLLGSLSPKDRDRPVPMSNRTKGYLLMVIMFILPPLLLVGVIASLSALGLMTEALIGSVLGWGFFAILVAYITAGIVAYSIGLPGSTRVRTDEKQNHNKQTDQSPI